MPTGRTKMPLPAAAQGGRKKPSFRQRYDNLEQTRLELLQRLERYGERGRAHPSFKRAAVLLNETFRKASIAQRAAVLQAAAWVVELIENSIGLI
jgi:hypothetical protein